MKESEERALVRDGDGYHTRNHAGIGTIDDPIFDQLLILHAIQPIGSILEIGCTNGFRLNKARHSFGSEVTGLDASPAAIAEGKRLFPGVELTQGIAPRDLGRLRDRYFDVVVLGHFLYLLPRSEIFELAAIVDRFVKPDGHLIVMDFISEQPMSAPYTHESDLAVYKHDPSSPWSWSPTYALVSRQIYSNSNVSEAALNPGSWQTVDVLRKLSIQDAYPQRSTFPSVHDGTSC